MTITGARDWLDIAPVAVASRGILSVATIIDVPNGDHRLLGSEYETDACADAHVWLEFCTKAGITCPPGASPTGSKEFANGPELVVGEPFAVYAGVECDLIRMDTALNRARRRLEYAEGFQVDEFVREFLETSPDTVSIGPGPNPVTTGVGLLEGYAATVYGGIPTLIMERSKVICACAAGFVCRDELTGVPMTCLGTPVAAIAGDPAAPTAQSNAYIVGRIILIRGPVNSYVAPPSPLCDGGQAPARALAERIYVPLIECLAAKTIVQCGDGTVSGPLSNPVPPGTLPEAQYLSNDSVAATSAPFTLHVHGEEFTDDAEILVNGSPWPTTFVSQHELTTVINPAAWTAGQTVQITVRTPNGVSTTSLPLAFT